mmetsp:Transcript_37307/g.87369  ORF Transcript_37307/g.87369 Transcript_37307/m.87369 type:complete len:348 (+) Transcript_37307:1058-2101(+)
MSIVSAQDCKCLGDSLHLQLPRLLALLPLLVGHGALLLEHHEELLVSGEAVLGVLNVHLGLGVLLVRGGKLLGLAVNLLSASRDLGLLCRLQIVVGLLVGQLLLLRVTQVGLEGLQHLPQDAEDLARLGSVGLLEGGRSVEVILRLLDEGSCGTALGRSEHTLQQGGVLLHLVLEGGGDAEDVATRNLQEGCGVVLGQHCDGSLQSGDGLQQILLLSIELSQLLLPQGSRLLKGLLVGRALLLQGLDLSVQLRTETGQLLDLAGEVCDACLRLGNCLGLLLVVGLAPARQLLVDLLVLLLLLLQLLRHVLQEVDHLGHGPLLGRSHIKAQGIGSAKKRQKGNEDCNL